MSQAGPGGEGGPPLAAKVAALSQPGFYGAGTRSVQALQTHLSWVFLTETEAYKLKKPLRFHQQDFRTLTARRFFCEQELLVNRRLAPEVYLGLVALTQEADGSLRLGGQGRQVEWLVHMRRLPREGMLDTLLVCGQATPDHMARIARRLAAFYRGQPRVPLGRTAYVERIAARLRLAREQLLDPAWGLPARRVASLFAQLEEALVALGPQLDARLAQGHVLEAHGDLRPEHVYLGEPLAIIDALEFSFELRTQDSADEVGFLALECERAGEAWLGAELLRCWRAEAGDAVSPAVLNFYQACRACDRAMLAVWHLHPPRHEDPLHWRRRARRWLALAQWHGQACGAEIG